MSGDRNLEQPQEAAEDPIRRALLHASLLEPEELSPEDEAAIDEVLSDDSDISHAEVLRLLKR